MNAIGLAAPGLVIQLGYPPSVRVGLETFEITNVRRALL
jgi:hypothetical protein